MIAELLGAPPDDWEKFRRWSDACTGNADPEIELDSFVGHRRAVRVLPAADRGSARRATGRHAVGPGTAPRSTGVKLTDEDLLNFAFLLLVAGNETTRNLIALGTLALIEHPDECAKLVDDPTLIPGAVEEMLRWSQLRSPTWPGPRRPTSRSAGSASARATWS